MYVCMAPASSARVGPPRARRLAVAMGLGSRDLACS